MIDGHCGEWGGNQKTILVYRDDERGTLLADYEEIMMDCNSQKYTTTISIKRKALNHEENTLLLQCITELTRNKLNKKDEFVRGGIQSRIMLLDSSLLIIDYPSVEWSKFNELAEKIN